MIRRTRPLALALALLALLPAAAGAKTRGFSFGVAAGNVTANSALVWTRTDKPGNVTVQLDFDRGFLPPVATGNVVARSANDNTLSAALQGLKPGRTYFYRFVAGGRRSDIGRFETAPVATRNVPIRFAFTGDADFSTDPKTGKPGFNNFEVYDRVRRENNDFNFNFGDTIYSDSEISGLPPARTVQEKWAKYKTNLSNPNLQRLRGSTGILSHWDDHEFINDFTIPENGRALYTAGVKAFTDYAPVRFTSRDGLYRSFRWGRNAEFFLLDERSFRSAKADDDCKNPQTGQPDQAPTAPQRTRDAFAVVVPSLSQPVSQQCKDAINDPKRTMLGKRQFDRFTAAVKASNATWKVVMNEVPIQQFYALPYDRWEGYAAERSRLLTYLQDNVKNLVFLTTDTHANFINNVRFRTLEDPGPLDSRFDEFITGPVATNTFSKEIDIATGRPGSGRLVTGAFFRQPPPNGAGMRCANPDVYSYAEVNVTSSKLVVTAKDANGQTVKDQEDPNLPCVLTLTKQ